MTRKDEIKAPAIVGSEAGTDRMAEYEAMVSAVTEKRQPIDSSINQKIDSLIQDIDSNDDIICRVNCLQLLADLTCSREAIALLEEKQVPRKLITLLNQNDSLIVPHALKFFYRIDPEQLENKYPEVLDKLCEYCDSDSRELLDYAIDLIGFIAGKGFKGRQVLNNHPHFKAKCLGRFGSVIVSSDPMIKSRTLRCVADLLKVQEWDSKDESSKLSETFYHAILPGEFRMTRQILALCRVPIMEIRINALFVVAAVADQVWAQKELAAQPEFLSWLLNRSTEKCKESKEAKFEILKSLIESKTALKAFKGEDYMKMRADFKNGPFHVGIAEEMLTDDKPAN